MKPYYGVSLLYGCEVMKPCCPCICISLLAARYRSASQWLCIVSAQPPTGTQHIKHKKQHATTMWSTANTDAQHWQQPNLAKGIPQTRKTNIESQRVKHKTRQIIWRVDCRAIQCKPNNNYNNISWSRHDHITVMCQACTLKHQYGI